MQIVHKVTGDVVSEGSGAMFDRIAARYDTLNRIMSLGMDRYWRWQLFRALKLQPGHRVLDVATGTGDVGLGIMRRCRDCTVIGIDPSQGMLDVAKQKSAVAGVASMSFVQGDAQALPFEANYFDSACIAFGIRNVPNRQLGLSEMFRVVRPGGVVAVLELGEPDSGILAGPARFYIRHIVPRLGALLSGAAEYRYLQASIAAFPAAPRFADLMADVGKAPVSLRRLGFGACNLYTANVSGNK